MKNILMGGVYYGLHNIGDEAILYQMLNDFSDDETKIYYKTYGSEWARDIFPNAVPLRIGDQFIRTKFGIYYARKPILKAIKKMLFPDLNDFKNKDLYICGGATILSDCPWYSLRTILMANKAGVPTVLWGVGMAELDDIKTLKFIAKVCNNSVMQIYTRDEYTLNRLISIGVNKSKLKSCYDPALMLNGNVEKLKRELSREQNELLAENNENICITLSGEEDIVNRTPLGEIERYIKEVTKTISGRVFLVPTGCGGHCFDRDLLRNLAKIDKTVFIEQELSPDSLISLLSKMKLVVSSRLHLNILAAVSGTPSIGIVRNNKIIDFAKLFSLNYININELTAVELITQTKILLSNHDQIVARINMKLNEVRNIHYECVNEVKQRWISRDGVRKE